VIVSAGLVLNTLIASGVDRCIHRGRHLRQP
jgi:hypothetical protein